MKYKIKDMISRFRLGTLDIPNGTYTTQNEICEDVIVYIKEHELHFATAQYNNHIRHNVYYDDGTQEEYYD